MKLTKLSLIFLITISLTINVYGFDGKPGLSTLKKVDSQILSHLEKIRNIHKSKHHKHLSCKDNNSKKNVAKKHQSKKKFFKKLTHFFFMNKFGKKFGFSPYTLKEIETSNPNLLTIEIDSYDIKKKKKGKKYTQEKYTPKSLSYNIFKKERRFPGIQKGTTANLYDVNGKKRFDINIQSLSSGEYGLFVKIISNKTSDLNKKNHKKHKRHKKIKDYYHFARIGFSKLQANLMAKMDILLQDEQKSRILIDMANSTSDQGAITKYITRLFENDILASENEYLISETTQFGYVFTNTNTTYQIELEVFDEFGNSAKVLSEKITPLAIAPIINYALTQDDTHKDLFRINFAGSTTPEGTQFQFFGIRVMRDGAILEEKFSVVGEFEFQIKTRGEFVLMPIIGASNGTINFAIDPLNYLEDTLPKSLVLNYSHHFFDDNDPRKLFVAFNNEVTREEFEQFNVTLTHLASGFSTSYVSDFYIFDQNILHALVGATQSGEYRFDIELELQNGTKSIPFSLTETFNIDLGVASINLDITLVENKTRVFNLSTIGSSAGNYGNFATLTCHATHNETSEQISVEIGVGISEVALQTPGLWNVLCNGVTTLGLTAQATSSVNIVNEEPVVNLAVNPVDVNNREYNAVISTNDSDGSIDSLKLYLSHASFETLEYDVVNGSFPLTLTATGEYTIELVAIDNEGAEVRVNENVTIDNLLPSVDFSIQELDVVNKQIKIELTHNDVDGNVIRSIISMTTPSGSVHEYETADFIDLTLWEIGVHQFSVTVYDNDGGSTTTDMKQYESLNNAPKADFEVILGEKSFQLIPNFTDIDGSVVGGEITVIDPKGFETQYSYDKSTTYFAFYPGEFRLVARAVDELGAQAVLEQSFTLEFENLAPVAILNLEKDVYKQFEVIELNAIGSYDPENSPLSYEWTFNDGTVKKGETVFHHLQEIGDYNATLKIKDISGLETQVQENFSIEAGAFELPEPVIEISGTQNENEAYMGGLYVSAVSSSSNEGDVIRYHWDMGDGSTYNTSSVEHKYTAIGKYEVKLEVYTDFGVGNSVVEVINISQLEDPRKQESDFNLILAGIDQENFNSVELSVSLQVDQSDFYNGDYYVSLNEDSITGLFEKNNDKYEAQITAEEGLNILSVTGYDLNQNLIQKRFEFISGSRIIDVIIKDKLDNLISNASTELSISGMDKKITLISNESGVVQFTNIPNQEFNIKTMHEGKLGYTFGNSNISTYEIIIDNKLTEVNSGLADFSNGIDTWNKKESNINLFDSEVPYVSLFADTSEGAFVSKVFNYKGEETFLNSTLKVFNLNPNHIIELKVINHTTGEAYLRKISELNRPVSISDKVRLNLNDVVEISTEIIPIVVSSSFNLFNSFKAYASGLFENTTCQILLSHEIGDFELKLLDLNNKKIGNDSIEDVYNLTELKHLSIGSYENDKNPIYLSLEIANLLDDIELQLEEISVKNSSGNKLINYTDPVDSLAVFFTNTVLNPIVPWTVDPTVEMYEGVQLYYNGVNHNLGSETPIVEVRKSEASELGRFTPSFYLPSNLIPHTETVVLDIRFKFKRISDGNIGYFSTSKIFNSNNPNDGSLLVNHNLPANKRYFSSEIQSAHAGFNLGKPDYGDYWVNQKLVPVLESLTSVGGLDAKVGDASNINGNVFNAGVGSSFAPHISHHNGRKIDLQTKHFGRGATNFSPSAFLDMLRMASDDNFVKSVSKIQVTRSSLYGRQYENFCIDGITVDKIVGEGIPDHTNHWHVEMYHHATRPFVNSSALSSSVQEEPYELDFKKKRVKHVFKIDEASRRNSAILYKQTSANSGQYKDEYFSINNKIYKDEDSPVHIVRKSDSDSNTLELELYIKFDHLDEFRENYKLYFNEVESPYITGHCAQKEYELPSSYETDDCNADDIKGDIGYLTEFGGVLGEGVGVNPELIIANGARVCGSSTVIDVGRGQIDGVNIVIEDGTQIGNQCEFAGFFGHEFVPENKDMYSRVDGVFCTDYIQGNPYNVENDLWVRFLDPVKPGKITNTAMNGVNHHLNPDFSNLEVYSSGFYSDNTVIKTSESNTTNPNIVGGFVTMDRATVTNTEVRGPQYPIGGGWATHQGFNILSYGSDPVVTNANIRGVGFIHSSRVINADINGNSYYVNDNTRQLLVANVNGGGSLVGNSPQSRASLSGNSSIYGTSSGNVSGRANESFHSSVEAGANFSGTIASGCFYRVTSGFNFNGSLCNEIYRGKRPTEDPDDDPNAMDDGKDDIKPEDREVKSGGSYKSVQMGQILI